MLGNQKRKNANVPLQWCHGREVCGTGEVLEKEKTAEHGFNEDAAVVWADLISSGFSKRNRNDKSEAWKPCQAAKIHPHTN